MHTQKKIALTLLFASAVLASGTATAGNAPSAPLTPRPVAQPLVLRSSETLASRAVLAPVNLKLSERMISLRAAQASAPANAELVQR